MINNKTIRQVVINKALLPCTPGELEYHEIATTAGGYSVSFTTNTEQALQDMTVDIVPIQSGEGDPSPDNIRPITGVDKLRFLYASFPSATVMHNFEVELGQTVYGGEVDIDGGVVTSNFAMVQVKSLNWTAQSNFSRLYTAGLQGLIDVNKLIVCEFAKGVPWDSVWTNIPLNSISVASSGNVFFKTTDYTDKDTFLSDLGDYYICYPLATPVTAQITPVEVLSIKGRQKMQCRERFEFSLKYPIMVGGSCELAKQFLPIFYPNGKGVNHNGSTF